MKIKDNNTYFYRIGRTLKIIFYLIKMMIIYASFDGHIIHPMFSSLVIHLLYISVGLTETDRYMKKYS